jgi:predicted N-formylglutamate amidohydrolase
MTTGFEIRQGDANSAVILHVPHSSTRIPEDVRANITLSDEALNQELLRITDSFIGTYVPLEQFGTDQRVHSVMIEIRRDLYMDEATGEPNGDALEVLGIRLGSLF